MVAAGLAALALLIAGCGGGGSASSEQTGPRTGEQVFADVGCGSCHTLAAAGATGTVGSSLDEGRRTPTLVARWVRDGGKGMPAFSGQLSEEEIDAVARYVAKTGGR